MCLYRKKYQISVLPRNRWYDSERCDCYSKSWQNLDDTKQTQIPLTPVCPPSSLYPSSPQEEARLHPAEHKGDDAAGRAPGDPQHRQRLWVQQCPHVPGPRPLFRHPHHLGGALHQPGSPPPRHDRLQLVHRAPPEANPPDKCQKCTSSCWGPENGGDEQTSQRRLAVGVCVRRALTDVLWRYWWDVHAPWPEKLIVPNIITSHLKKLDSRYSSYCTRSQT